MGSLLTPSLSGKDKEICVNLLKIFVDAIFSFSYNTNYTIYYTRRDEHIEERRERLERRLEKQNPDAVKRLKHWKDEEF